MSLLLKRVTEVNEAAVLDEEPLAEVGGLINQNLGRVPEGLGESMLPVYVYLRTPGEAFYLQHLGELLVGVIVRDAQIHYELVLVFDVAFDNVGELAHVLAMHHKVHLSCEFYQVAQIMHCRLV